MAVITAANIALLNKMNQIAKKCGLGTQISNISGTHRVLAAGNFTTLGGDASESITVTGATSSDIAIVVLKTAGATPRTITTAAAGTNTVTVVLSGDPSTDHVLSYMVLRAV
jgi:hypothetical protein